MDDVAPLQRQPSSSTPHLAPCRQCGASTFHRTPRHSLWDRLLSLIGFSPVRCTQCLWAVLPISSAVSTHVLRTNRDHRDPGCVMLLRNSSGERRRQGGERDREFPLLQPLDCLVTDPLERKVNNAIPAGQACRASFSPARVGRQCLTQGEGNGAYRGD